MSVPTTGVFPMGSFLSMALTGNEGEDLGVKSPLSQTMCILPHHAGAASQASVKLHASVHLRQQDHSADKFDVLQI